MNTRNTAKPVAYSPALAGWKKFSRWIAKTPPQQWIFGVGKYPVAALMLYWLAHTRGDDYLKSCLWALALIVVHAAISWVVRAKDGRHER